MVNDWYLKGDADEAEAVVRSSFVERYLNERAESAGAVQGT